MQMNDFHFTKELKSTWVPPEKFIETPKTDLFQQVILLRFIFLALGFVGFML